MKSGQRVAFWIELVGKKDNQFLLITVFGMRTVIINKAASQTD